MKKIWRELGIVFFFALVAVGYYFYQPQSVRTLLSRLDVSGPAVLDEERLRLDRDLSDFLARGLPKDEDKTPTLLHLFLGHQRQLLDQRLGAAIENINLSEVDPGEAKIWSFMNMGTVVKTSGKIIAFDLADMPWSAVQKKMANLADVFLVTHADLDHYDQALIRQALKLGKKVIFPAGFLFNEQGTDSGLIYKLGDGETIDLEGVRITTFRTDHRGDKNFQEPNAWYLVEAGELKFLHTGDGREFIDPQKKRNLVNYGVDVFLANYQTHPYDIRDIAPKVVVPLHLYRFQHNREELARSGFAAILGTYGEYEKDLVGVDVQMLFPGESFAYPHKYVESKSDFD